MPFSDMVLAVHTRAPTAHLDEQCEGSAIALHSEQIDRPLLASLLQVPAM